MRVLLDECVPRKLGRDIHGHTVTTVAKASLGGSADMLLLQAAQAELDVLVTVDRNLLFQQNLATLPIATIVLHAKSNRYADLKELAPSLLHALNHIKPHRCSTCQYWMRELRCASPMLLRTQSMNARHRERAIPHRKSHALR